MSAIYILWLRELRRYVRSRAQIVASLGQPLMYLIAIGSALENMQGFQLIMNFLVMPIFFLSGALYPLTNLAAGFRLVVSLDPLAYGVDGLRGSLLGVSHFGAAIDALVLVGVACILL